MEAPTPLSVGAMPSGVGVSRVTLSKHIREGRVTVDSFEGNRAPFQPESAERVKAELHANRVRNWRFLPSDDLLYAN